MQPLTTLTSTFVPLPIESIDTDQIIPAEYLKATSRTSLHNVLFHHWRFDDKEQPIEYFVLNDSRYSGEILVVGKNFGCGSSREHAVWAIADYGFRVVISSSFADIFSINALNNGVLPLQVPDEFLQNIVSLPADTTLTVNLAEHWVRIDSTGEQVEFPISHYKQVCLLNGYNDIDYLVNLKGEIETYEHQRQIIP